MASGTGPQVGEPAPDFCATDGEGTERCLADFRGRWLVLYFYPKDNTPGCTIEAIDFTSLRGEFERLNATVVGVSADSGQSHQRFTEKHDLGITLLSDPEHEVMRAYGAWQQKKLYGKSFLGIVRSTVLIDPEGNVAHHWPKVSAKGHAEEVRRMLAQLQSP